MLNCEGFDWFLAVQLSALNNQTSNNLGSETTPFIHYLMSFDLDFRYFIPFKVYKETALYNSPQAQER